MSVEPEMSNEERRAAKKATRQRTTIRQSAIRGVDDRAVLEQILDVALIGHVSLIEEGMPVTIPTAIVRIDDHVYLHGSRTSRLYRHLAGGNPVCISFCLLDGLVKARSAFHCSMNYRSVVIFGCGTPVGGDEKAEILFQLTERLFSLDRRHYREHLAKELKATELVRIPLDEVSVKVRTGGPNDDDEDMNLPLWAGEYPLEQIQLEPIASADLLTGIAAPKLGG